MNKKGRRIYCTRYFVLFNTQWHKKKRAEKKLKPCGENAYQAAVCSEWRSVREACSNLVFVKKYSNTAAQTICMASPQQHFTPYLYSCAVVTGIYIQQNCYLTYTQRTKLVKQILLC